MSDKPELYLILHKVRNEPAFDIAHQIEMEGEECWIVGTSGHKAYPYWTVPLAEIKVAHGEYDNMMILHALDLYIPELVSWDDWPDHYNSRSSPTESRVEAKSLLASLGLPTTTHNAMVGKLVRRV